MMKKNIVMLMVLFTAYIQGMETNSCSIMVGATKINLTKGFIGDVDDRVDMIVVGKNQQSKFTTSFFASCGGISCIGEISLKDSGTVHKIILKRNKLYVAWYRLQNQTLLKIIVMVCCMMQ